MSIKALQDYTVYARYAKYNKDFKRRETWDESVDRLFGMHEIKYSNILSQSEKLREYFQFAKDMVLDKRVLGSQRALQFGGEPILKHEAKIYNCAFTHVDRARSFQEIMYLLLCGCGVGFSVQKCHVDKLPSIKYPINGTKTFIIPDSIEGWADAIGVLVNSYFVEAYEFSEYNGYNVEFDYSLIREEGAFISGGFKAPGSKGLQSSIEKIRRVLLNCTDMFAESNLRPIDAYDIIMHSSDAVLSGGVRRSATLALFSPDDNEMINAKTGDWMRKNPQRGRSNNSAALVRGKVTREQFAQLIASTKQFGEPGFLFIDHEDIGANPCVEIGLYPKTIDGRSGVQFCNLTTKNASKCKTKEDFLMACKASAIIGTLQAGYTNFKYLSPESSEITAREALLGCSMTGVMENPEIILDPEIQQEGAELIKQINAEIAAIIGINPAARCTALKPEGTTSCLLGTSSGIHPHHARRYIRRVQANKLEFPVRYFEAFNPLAVEESVWSNNKTDMVISFLCEVPRGSIVKNQVSAIQLLEKVKLTQMNWVEYGTREELCAIPGIRHNVSNTITIKDNEWNEVEEFIWDNRKWFSGVSLLPFSGDLDYPQAPFATVLTPAEIVEEYGDGSCFASGLIVHSLRAFNNLWHACDAILNRGIFSINDYKTNQWHGNPEMLQCTPDELITKLNDFKIQAEWVLRAERFAQKYFNNDFVKMTHCLKHVHTWKSWCDLKREYKEIDWCEVIEENEVMTSIDTLGASACAGGKCSLDF